MNKLSEYDPMNGFNDDMIWYTNYSVDPSGFTQIRTRYNVSDICREVGGIISLGLTLGHVFVLLFTNQKLELKLLKNHTKLFHPDKNDISND